MAEEQQVGAVQLGARLHGVSPPVTRRLRIAEQASLAELHAWPSRAIDVESPELGISW